MSKFALCGTLLAILAPVLTGCGDDNLPKRYELGGLRVLALHSSAPEVAPGDTVTLTPLVSDFDGEGRALTFSADGCLDPGVGFGAEPNCEGSATRVELAAAGTAVTGLAAPDYTGLLTSTFTATVPIAGVIFAGRTAAEQNNGVPYLVTFAVAAADGTESRAFRRILVSSRATKNQNPTLTGGSEITVDGAVVATKPEDDADFAAAWTAGSKESYADQTASGGSENKTESLEIAWFVSEGEVAPSVTLGSAPAAYSPPKSPSTTRNLVVVAVVRDGRAGSVSHVLSLAP
ncbi:MAG: hypothetical protein IT285_01555 [Bdellovibrionales bacterium]|nr:hypothetical protein [Bdellovibrionales bacterium]